MKLTINREVDESGENIVVFGKLRMSFYSDSHKAFYSKSSKDALLRWLYTQTTGKPDDALRTMPWKEFYTTIGDEWGCSVAKIMPILQHTIYYHLVVPKMEVIKHVCFWKKAHTQKKIHVITNYKSIEQVVKDGNGRLLPLMYKKNCYDTKELKEFYGSGLWKYICSCKKNRISLIAKHKNMGDAAWGYIHKIPTGLLDAASPVTYYPNIINEKDSVKIIDWVGKNISYTKCNAHKLISLLRDTVVMSAELGKPVNFNKLKGYGYEDIVTLHDNISFEHQKKQDEIQSKRMDLVLCSNYPYEIVYEDVSATLLDTRRKLGSEGIEMHHCVSYYASYVERGEYLVYSVRGDGEKSTIGLQKGRDGWEIEQVRGVCNASVSEKHKMFALHVLKEINKEYI